MSYDMSLLSCMLLLSTYQTTAECVDGRYEDCRTALTWAIFNSSKPPFRPPDSSNLYVGSYLVAVWPPTTHLHTYTHAIGRS